jgi:hypothetical protein
MKARLVARIKEAYGRGKQAPYAFKDVPTLIRDFLQDVQETES